MALEDKGKYLGSAAQGAVKGAKIGSLVGMPLAGAAVGGVGSALLSKSKDKHLAEDIKRMEAGQLGMTDAEIRQKSAAAKTAAGKQVGAMQKDLAQQALASGGGAIPSGQYAKMMAGLGSSAAEAGANIQAKLELEDAALAQQEATRIKEEERERNAVEEAKLTSALGEIAAPGGKVLGEKLGVKAEDALTKIFGAQALGTSGLPE